MKRKLTPYEIILLVLGLIFVLGTLTLIMITPEPSKWQFWSIRIVMSLGAGCIGSFLPGLLTAEFSWKNVVIKSTGAAAFFVIVYLLNPPPVEFAD
jgi:hypothetical protein